MQLKLLRTEDSPHLPFIRIVDEIDALKYALTENDAREAKLREEIVGVRNHCDPGGGRRWEAMGGCGIAVGGGERCWEALGGAGVQWEAQEAVEVVGGVGRRWSWWKAVEGV